MTSYIPILSCRVEIINEHEQLHPSASVDTVGDTVHPSNMDVSVLVCVFVHQSCSQPCAAAVSLSVWIWELALVVSAPFFDAFHSLVKKYSREDM